MRSARRIELCSLRPFGGFPGLTVICAWAVLAEEMLVQEVGLHGFRVRKETQRFASKANQMLKDDRIMDSIIDSFAPGEGAVAGNEHARTMQRVTASKSLHDDIAGVHFVIISDFARVKTTGARNRTVKVIGVCSAKSGNGSATLSPGGGIETVRVNDPANLAKSAIKYEVSFSIRAGLQIALDDFSGFERDDDHVFGFHDRIGNAGRFDDHVPAGAVDTADVTPGLNYEALGYELEVGVADLFFESVEHVRKFEIRKTGCQNETALVLIKGV